MKPIYIFNLIKIWKDGMFAFYRIDGSETVWFKFGVINIEVKYFAPTYKNW